jgi:hypothetical protein
MSRTLSVCLVAGALLGAGLLIAGASTLKGDQAAQPPAGTPVEAAGFIGSIQFVDTNVDGGPCGPARCAAPVRVFTGNVSNQVSGQPLHMDGDPSPLISRLDRRGLQRLAAAIVPRPRSKHHLP